MYNSLVKRIYNILVGLLGDSKQGWYDDSETQYQFNCPFCAEEKGGVDNKYNLEVSFSLGKFHCWSCGNAGPISKLIHILGGKELANEYRSILKELKEANYYNIDMFKDNSDFMGDKYLKLPKTFHKINLQEERNKQLIEYLAKRKITQDIIDCYNIGVTGWDNEEHAWRNRIIIPSYDKFGELNYYIGRTYRENDKRVKYRNCDVDKNEIILHEDKIQWDADIYLVEGAIDCIYYPNSIAMMGKFLNKNMCLYKKLFEQANSNIIICLDGDTEISEVKRIYKTLNHGRLYGKIRYVKFDTDIIPYKDFGELYESEGRDGIIRMMKEQKSFKDFEL